MIKTASSGAKAPENREISKSTPQDLHKRIQTLKEKAEMTKPANLQIKAGNKIQTFKILSPLRKQPTPVIQQVRSAISPRIRLIIDQNKNINFLASALSGIWIGTCIVLFLQSPSFLAGQFSVETLGAFLSLALMPVAFFWLALSNYQRRADVAYYTSQLRYELHNILFPKGESPDRVKKDIELLCQQASQLTASSNAVVSSVEKARQNLRDERQEYVGVSKQTELHIEQLIQNLSDKTEQLQSVSSELEHKFESIQKTTKTTTKQTMGLADKLEVAIQNAEEQNSQSLSRFESVEGSIIDQVQKLDTVSHELESQVSGMNDKLIVQLGEIDDRANHVFENLADGADKLSEQKEIYEKITENLSERLTQLERVEKTSHILENSLKGLKDFSYEIEAAGKKSANTLNKSIELSVSGADALHKSVTSSAKTFHDAMNDMTDHTEMLVNEAVRQIKELQLDEAQQKEFLEDYLQRFAEQQDKISAIKGVVKEELSETSDILDDRVTKLNEAINALDKPFAKIEGDFEGFDKRFERLSDVIEGRLSSLDKSGQKILGQIEGTSQTLHDHVQSVSKLSGEIAAQTQKANHQMTAQKESMSGVLNATINEMSNVSNTLQENVEKAEKYAEKYEFIINNINNNIKVSSEEVKGLSDKSVQTLRLFGHQINDELSRFDDICNNLRQKTEQASSNIETTLQSMTPNCQTIFNQIESLDGRLKDLKDNISDVSDENMQRLEMLTKEFDMQLLSVNQTSAEAIGSLNNVNDGFALSVEKMKDASEKALKTVTQAKNDFRLEIQDFNQLGDEVTLKVSDVQKEFEAQNTELSEIIGGISVQVQSVVHDLNEATRLVADSSEDIVAQVTESIKETEQQTQSWQKAAEERLLQTKQIVSDVTNEAENCLTQTAEHIEEMGRTKNYFTSRHKDMEAQLESLLQVSGYYGEEIRKQTKTLSQGALDASELLTSAGRGLKNEISGLTSVADDVSLKIQSAQKGINHESKDFMRVSSEVLKHTEYASQNLAKQADSLRQASDDIRQSAFDMQTIMSEQEHEKFISSFQYILESIYSVTLDLARSLDGEISEKMWKAYNDGNQMVFMKHLLKVENDVHLPALISKYRNDSEFRTYTQRYIKQFESIYRQVQSSKNNDLMMAVVHSSDIARLYKVLVKISETEDIFQVAA